MLSTRNRPCACVFRRATRPKGCTVPLPEPIAAWATQPWSCSMSSSSPRSSPARCDAMLDRDLLDLLTDPPAEVIRWDTSRDPVAECARVEREVVIGGLQLAILGLGTNGHVGVNEPGSSPESRSQFVELHDETAPRRNRVRCGRSPRHTGSPLASERSWKPMRSGYSSLDHTSGTYCIASSTTQ